MIVMGLHHLLLLLQLLGMVLLLGQHQLLLLLRLCLLLLHEQAILRLGQPLILLWSSVH